MAGLLDPRNGDGTWVENRPSKASQLWGIAEPYVMGPWNAWKGLMDADLDTLLYDTGPKGQQAVENAFNVAGTVTGGSSVVPKPDDALNMGIKAFHGSPHDFDRFSLDKIGTGEGAQAYGHGLYFAENEGVAKGYRDALSRPLNTGDLGRDLANYAVTQKRGSVDDAIAYLNREMANYDNRPAGWPSPEYKKQYEDALGILTSGNWKPAGRMYEVEINAEPEQFLDWDKPLSEQPEAVRQALANIDPDMYSPSGSDYDPSELGQIAYQRMFHDTRKKIGPNQGAQTYQAEISRNLNQAGIPGIKYLDAGSRYTPANLPDNPIANEARQFLDAAQGNADTALRLFRESNPVERWAGSERDEITQVIKAAAKPVTRNYVVFDDNLINIIRKYGIAGLLGGGAAMNAMTAEPREQY